MPTILTQAATPPQPFHRFVENFTVSSGASPFDVIITPVVSPNGASQLTIWPFAQEVSGGASSYRLYVELLNYASGSYAPYDPSLLVQIPDTPATDFRAFATSDTSVVPIVFRGPPPFFRLRVENQSGGGVSQLSVFARFEGHFGVRG